MKKLNHVLILAMILVLGSCQKESLDSQEPDNEIQNLQGLIPDDFNFETERTVTMTINDQTANVKYEVYGYSSAFGNEAENIANALNNKVYTGKPSEGVINHAFSLSDAFDKVYISRKDGIEYTYEIRDISNDVINFTSPLEVRSANRSGNNSGNRTTNCGDCTQIWTNGDFEDGPTFPTTRPKLTDENEVDGWFTTATDGLIEIWPSGFRGTPSQSGSYHAELNANETAALYQRVCTTPNATFTWSVWHRARSGGGTDVATVRIGDNIITATVEAVMETDNTAWVEYTGIYEVPPGQTDTFLIFEAVSTASGSPTVGNFIDNVVIEETDEGDPCDGGTITYPGGQEPANLAFEDLWPSQGDYDFNDLVVEYFIIQNLDQNGDVTSLEYVYRIKNIGASYKNGFAVEFEGVDAGNIASITGQLDGNMGATTGANGAVVKFFNNADLHLGSINIVEMVFATPLEQGAGTGPGKIGLPPYNPFLLGNNNSAYEIHLPDNPTTMAQLPIIPGYAPAFAQTVDDADVNFKGDNTLPAEDINMPWALNIVGNYTPPPPGVDIRDCYPEFKDWAQSGGVTFPTWWLNNLCP